MKVVVFFLKPLWWNPAPKKIKVSSVAQQDTYGCFLKWWYPQNNPKWSFLVQENQWLLGITILGNPHIVAVNLSVPTARAICFGNKHQEAPWFYKKSAPSQHCFHRFYAQKSLKLHQKMMARCPMISDKKGSGPYWLNPSNQFRLGWFLVVWPREFAPRMGPASGHCWLLTLHMVNWSKLLGRDCSRGKGERIRSLGGLGELVSWT